MKKISIGAAIAVTLVGCLLTFETTYLVLQNKYEEKSVNEIISAPGETESSGEVDEGLEVSSEFMYKLVTKLEEVDYLYRNYYIGEIDDDKLIDMTISGYVAGTGDDYANYYNAEEFQEMLSDLEGEMSGIGINVIYNTDLHVIEVLNVMPDSPALEAGVQSGDLIITVGEDPVEYVEEIGYYAAVAKLQGKEGTEAIFSVARGEHYEETVDFRITRAKITEQTVMHHVYGPDATVGVIKITGFDSKTPEQFVAAVEDLTGQGCTDLVVDLRYNPGGELSSIVTVLDYILPEGPIIRIFDAQGNEVDSYYSEATELDIPMAVVVNGSTASAAELFTSALRDYEKAVIVGTTTYGKGCMQTTVPLSDASAVSITYRMYNPPYGENYHGVGITPHIEVELAEELQNKNIYKITDEEDNQLAAAVAALKE
ncbi:MAG: S41 family peptidase [Clostridia bacterium]|nr:S41 family peptidase [Clostridia bacterium]